MQLRKLGAWTRVRPNLEKLEDRTLLDVGDTIGAALATGLGPPPGTYNLANELLGDGPFGDRDVDMYQFQANAGSRINVRTTGICSSFDNDTILRLFTAAGQELAVNDDDIGFCSRIVYTFTTSGTYYFGVSGFPNFGYNPNVGGSGGSGATGPYGVEAELIVPPPGTINWTDSGWWDNTGSHTAANKNYVTGQIGGTQYRSFFVFDLTNTLENIVGARLRLFNPTNPPGFGYQSPDPTETYTMYDVSTPIPQLRANGSGQVGIFNDLGSGTEYGSQTVSSADNGRIVTIDLNAAAIAYLNAARGGLAALGGALTTLSGGADQFIFGFTNSPSDTRELILELGDPPAGPVITAHAPLFPSEVISSLRVTFDRPVNPQTFTPGDVSEFFGYLGELQATSVTPVVGSNNMQFDINFAEQFITGLYSMTLGPDIRDMFGNQMDQDRDGIPGEFDDRYLAWFGILGAQVTAATSGVLGAPVDRVRATFSRPMDPTSFAGWVYVIGPSGALEITGVQAVPGTNQTQIDILFAPQSEPGTYYYGITAGVRDVYGNPLDQNLNFIGGEEGEFPVGDNYSNTFGVIPAGCFAGEAFGYLACTGTFENINLELGQAGVFVVIPGCDDCFNPVNLGANTFSYYGTTYSQLFVSSNGLITFGSGNAQFTNENLTATPPQRAIAVLWDDWISPGPGMVLGRIDGNRLIIEWNNVEHFPTSPSGVTFQAILQLNTGGAPGNVSLNYVDLNTGDPNSNGASATVGIKDMGTQGPRRILAHFNQLSQHVGDGRAILIRTLSAAPTPGLGGQSGIVDAVTALSQGGSQDAVVQPSDAALLLKAALEEVFVTETPAGRLDMTSGVLAAAAGQVAESSLTEGTLFDLALASL